MSVSYYCAFFICVNQLNLRSRCQSGQCSKKRTQALRPYKSVLICAPDNYRGCVVCASYQCEPIAAPLNPPFKNLVTKRFPESVVGAFLDVDVGQGHTVEGVVLDH